MALIVKDLHKAYSKQEVLKGVDLEMKSGCITAVLGPNGSGKTTLIKCMLGMVIGQEGEIMAEGKNIGRSWLYRKEVGYLPQIARFPENLRVKELVEMIADIRNLPADPERLIRQFGIGDFLNKPLRHLSGGTRQKVNILITFMFDFQSYILDEPTVGLDPLSMVRFRELLISEKQKGKAILMTTHMVSLAEDMADEVVFLLEGKVYFRGSVGELREQYGGRNLEEGIANILYREQHA